ncbi:WD40 repeat domain-containing protein [Planctomycetota bacterium]
MFKSSNNKETKRYLIALIVLFLVLPCMSIDFSQEPSRLGEGQVTQIAFSPDATMLAAWYDADGDWRTSEGEFCLWDVQTQQQIGVWKKDLIWICSMAFSPDGTLIALGLDHPDNTIRLWDVAKQNQVGRMKPPARWGITSLVFSPDGRTLASSSGGNHTAHLWDVQTQMQIGVLSGVVRKPTQGFGCLAFSPDGKFLFSGGHRGDEAIRIWDVQTQKQVVELIGHLDITMQLAFSPERSLLASAGGINDAAVYLWDYHTREQVGVLGGHSAHVGSIAFSPDGKLLASAAFWNNTVQIWDIPTQTQVGVLTGHVASDGWGEDVEISSDGRWLACKSANGVELWEVNLPDPISKGCAYGPRPYNGTINPDTWVTLSWKPGDFAVSHVVYLSDNFDDVNTGTAEAFRGNQIETFFVAGFTGFPYPDALTPGKTYYWRIDEINDLHPDSPWSGDVWSFSIPPKTAYNPNPADGAELVDPDVELSWTAGLGAILHAVYFGDDFDDVNSATGGSSQIATTYTPGPPEFGKTYYWRVDNFTGGRSGKIHKGDVWSFTTLVGVGKQRPSVE